MSSRKANKKAKGKSHKKPPEASKSPAGSGNGPETSSPVPSGTIPSSTSRPSELVDRGGLEAAGAIIAKEEVDLYSGASGDPANAAGAGTPPLPAGDQQPSEVHRKIAKGLSRATYGILRKEAEKRGHILADMTEAQLAELTESGAVTVKKHLPTFLEPVVDELGWAGTFAGVVIENYKGQKQAEAATTGGAQ